MNTSPSGPGPEPTPPPSPVSQFCLRFQSLRCAGVSYAFPCSPTGEVDLDAMSLRQRGNYLYARSLLGYEFALPTVERDHSQFAQALRIDAAACTVAA
jgi:hypothetical protein